MFESESAFSEFGSGIEGFGWTAAEITLDPVSVGLGSRKAEDSAAVGRAFAESSCSRCCTWQDRP